MTEYTAKITSTNGVITVSDVTPLNDTRPLIEFYGDSTVWGLNSATSQRIAHPMTDYVQFPGYRVANRGVSGSGSAQLLAGDGVNLPWADQLAASSAFAVIVNHCINDAGLSNADYVSNMRQIRDLAVAAGKKFIMMTPNITNVGRVPALANLMRIIASEGNHGVIDIQQYTNTFAGSNFPDGIHPNQWAYRQIGLYANNWLANTFT